MPILVLLFLLCSLSCWAQVDSLKVNQLTVGMDFLTHGETCGGGLPKSTDGTESVEDRSSFLLGRFRLNIDYSRSWLQAHAVIQNNAGICNSRGFFCSSGSAPYQAQNTVVYKVCIFHTDNPLFFTPQFPAGYYLRISMNQSTVFFILNLFA